jgi:two-component system, LytTR family, response regulator
MRAIIIDDEVHCCTVMEQLLDKHCPQIQVLATCTDSLTGLNAIRKHQPDVVFLDIEMPRMNGFQLLETLAPDNLNFTLVFTTAYNEFAIRAFKFSAFDYLLKPIDTSELVTTVQKLTLCRTSNQQFQNLKDTLNGPMSLGKLTIATTKGFIFIDLPDILAIESDGNYSTIHVLHGKPVVASKNLRFFAEILADNRHFFRTHKQFIVNLPHIQEYLLADNLILLPKNIKAKLARTRKDAFLNLLKV